MATNTWIAAAAGDANIDANWSLGHYPQAGEDVRFTNVSANNCNWNIDVACSISLVGYTGILLLANALTIIITIDQQDSSGRINGNNKTITASGNITIRALSVNQPSIITMTTDGSTFYYMGSWGFANLIAAANVIATRFNGYSLTTNAGKKITLSGPTSMFDLSQSSSGNVVNNGAIDGDGELRLNIRTAKTLNLGDIACRVWVRGYESNAADYVAMLGSNTHIKSNLTISSANSTYAVTLNGGGYTLEVDGTFNIGHRGKAVQGAGEWIVRGAYTQYGVSSQFDQGAAITYWDDWALSLGNWNGNNALVKCYGDFLYTGGAIYSSYLNLEMAGDNKTCQPQGVYIDLTVSGDGLTYTYPGTARPSVKHLVLGTGKTLNIASGKTLGMMNVSMSFSNGGIVNGPGTLQFDLRYSDITVNLGVVNAPVNIYGHASMGGSYSLILGDSPTLGSSVNLYSYHATNTASLDLNGKTLGATAININSLGRLTGHGTVNAPLTVSAGTLNNTGEMRIYGLVTVSGGFLDQDAIMHCYNGVAVTAGTVTGPTNPLIPIVLHDCDFVHTGGTVTGTTVSFKTYGACSIATSNTACAYIVTDGSVCIKASANTISSRVETEVGGELVLGNSCEFRYYSASTYVNLGRISGAGKNLQLSLYDANKTIELGDVGCNILVRALTVATADRTLSLLVDEDLPGNITVDSQHTTYKAILDQAGHSLKAKDITASTLGKILGDGGTSYTGDWDTSLGEFDPEGCMVNKEGIGTEKLGAGQAFYDLTAEVEPLNLASDIRISNIYRHARAAVLNGYALTLDRKDLEDDIFVDSSALHGRSVSTSSFVGGSNSSNNMEGN